ncbi:MAG: RICIN domain-containing protein [Actinomycetaceae bacterium]|nr:RICIN domain-containing protein [Actinomycetaceae bacterium]
MKLKKVFAGAAVIAVAGAGIGALASSSNAATPGVCPLSGVVSAPAPTFNDADGMTNDTVTIPESECINYTLNGFNVDAGTYRLSNFAPYGLTDTSNGWKVATATVQAEVKADHWQLSGTYWWQQGFVGIYDPQDQTTQVMTGAPARAAKKVEPTAPTFTDSQGLNDATVTIPQQEGVTYTIKGDKKTAVVAAGTYTVLDYTNLNDDGKARLTVTATSSDKKKYVITGTSTWTQDVAATLVSGTTSPNPTPVPALSRPITDGTYVITSALNANKALDVNGGSKDNGANVQLWDRNNGRGQVFQVTYLGDSQYSIINVHSGKSLDVKGSSTKAGANVLQWTWNDTKNQRFYFVPAKNGGYSIQVVSSGLYLDVTGSRTANGTNIIQWKNGGTNNQVWNFVSQGSTTLKEVTAPDVLMDTVKCTVIIPNAEGVDYYMGNKKLAPGTDLTKLDAWTAPVTVKAQAGYKLTNPNASWSSFYCIGEPARPQPTTPTKVEFVAPTFDQKNNKYTIPDVEGLQYSVDGKNVAAGTYDVVSDGSNVDNNGRMTVSITAKLKAGYTNKNGWDSYTWQATFAVRTVTPVAPTYKAGWSFWFIKSQSEYIIPSVTGIDYYVNGSKVEAGTYKVPSGTTVSVEAKPQAGYSFPLNTTIVNRWTFQGI